MRFITTPPNHSTKFTLLPLTAIVSSILLTACGSFSSPAYIEAGINPTVIPKAPTKPENQPAPPSSVEENNAPKIDPLFKPALSAVMPIPKRKIAKNKEDIEYFGQHEALSEEALKNNSQRTLADLEKELKENYDQKNKERYQSAFKESISPYKKTQDENQFVKTGWIFSYFYADKTLDQKDKNSKPYTIRDGDGYIYYYAEQPTIGRTKGSAEYTGSWDFVTDAKYDRRQNGEYAEQNALGGGETFSMDRYWGDDMGATSFAEKSVEQYSPRQGNHQATFNVNFDDKTLTGKLSNRKKETVNGDWKTTDRYTIDAKINGNRFFGSAKASDNKTTLQFFQKDATNRLEGGFFGPNAEELGGRFLTDDNSVFGVFSGKQKNAQALETRYDGLYVDVTQDDQINPAQKATTHTIPNFGNVNQLQIGSQLIELLPNNHTQQTVKLASGQTAVITSFGTADGLLRLGSVNKVGETTQLAKPKDSKQAPKPTYSDDEIRQAKEKVEQAGQKFSEDIEASINKYLEDQTPEAKDKIIKNILSAFNDPNRIKAKLEQLFEDLKEDEDKIYDILDVVDRNDKYSRYIEANWQAYLPQRSLESLYSKRAIENAKVKLTQKIDADKEELTELVEGYLALDSASEEEQKQSEQAVITKVLEAYSPNQHSIIKAKVKYALDQDDLEDKILKIFSEGDKFDPSKLDNLKAFLPSPDKDGNNPESEELIALDDSIRGFYLLGDRTPVSQIPEKGTANYTGTWHGRIGNHWQSEAGKGEYASKANFDVNFSDKKLTGTLTEKKGSNAAFNIDAAIKDNGFSGTISIARTTGIDLDPNRQQNKQILKTIENGKVQGGFYGDNAKHLAGTFAFDGKLDDQTESEDVVGGGVFYGTTEKVIVTK